MEYERKGVAITWLIENTKYIGFQDIELYSPVITVDVMDGTKWKLGLHRIEDSTISLTVNREAEDNGPEIFGLDYEFSVKPLHILFSNRKVTSSWKFRKGKKSREVAVYKHWGIHFHPDTITILCTIYRRKGSILKSSHVSARTRMKTERCKFVADIQIFNDLPDFERKTVKIVSTSAGEKLIEVNFFLVHGEWIWKKPPTKIYIEFQLKDKKTELFFIFKLFIVDSSGYKTHTYKFKDDIALKSKRIISLPGVSKEDLLRCATEYLQKDTLFLYCEITFSFEIDYEKVERTEYETDFVDEVKQTDFSKAVAFEMSLNDIHCDTRLQTATETFPANRAILSAESPVFEAMFKTDMKEAVQTSVNIDDVDAVTVKRMLVFLYSDNVEELEWKDAMKLYFAADKYQLPFLKRKCACLLEKSIDLSNCCALLLLAYMHQDMKTAVQKYIIEYYKQVLYCDQWRDLEKNHPQLTVEALRDIFLKSMASKASRKNVKSKRY